MYALSPRSFSLALTAPPLPHAKQRFNQRSEKLRQEEERSTAVLVTLKTFKCEAHDHTIERHWCLMVLHLIQSHQQRGHKDHYHQQPLTASGTASGLRRRGGGGLLVNLLYSNVDKICNTSVISNHYYHE